MQDIKQLINFLIGFIALLFGIVVLSLIIKELPVDIAGLKMGPLILGAFIFFAIAWFVREAFEK